MTHPSNWRQRWGITPIFAIFIFSLVGLPFALVWTVKKQMQAESLGNARAVSELLLQMRRYYNFNIVNRLQDAQGPVIVTENYHNVPGSIPLPATMSIEVAKLLSEKIPNSPFDFSFTSDHPFHGRNRPAMDTFQREALAQFRAKPNLEEYWRQDTEAHGEANLRLAIPVRMQTGCVACHNNHPESTKRDWEVGDIRGIQDVTVRHIVSEGRLENFLFLIGYLVFFLVTLIAALQEYRRSISRLRTLNYEQAETRQLLEDQQIQLHSQVNDLQTKTTVLDRAPFGIVIADPHQLDFPIVYANEAFERITGYPQQEIIGRNCRFLQGPKTDRADIQVMREAIKQQKSTEVELVNYRRDGLCFYNRLMLFPCLNTAGELISYVGCVYDISEFKQATREKEKLAGELQESLKLESLGLTIAGIAHDLNTPIGIALTASSHMDKTLRQMHQQAEVGPADAALLTKWETALSRATNLIKNNLGKAAELVRSFKQTTADATRVEWRRIALKPFLETLVVSISPLMKRSQSKVSLDCPADLHYYSEPGSLSQILTNLVVNASIHAFDGRENRQIIIRVTSTEDSGLCIEVSDNGNGMSQEAVTKAFTPFFTTRRGAGGSGLGLFSSRRIVENTLGGSISVTSERDVGTKFLILLPPNHAPVSVDSMKLT